jgi:hypothetical protein
MVLLLVFEFSPIVVEPVETLIPEAAAVFISLVDILERTYVEALSSSISSI